MHLSRPAVAILRPLAEQREKVPALKASPYVFTGANGRRIESFSHMKEVLDKAMEEEAGIAPEPFQLRDLRRTAATVLARLGAAPHVVERILNHASAQALGGPLAAVYNTFGYDDARIEALDKLAAFVVSLAEPRVVPLKRA